MIVRLILFLNIYFFNYKKNTNFDKIKKKYEFFLRYFILRYLKKWQTHHFQNFKWLYVWCVIIKIRWDCKKSIRIFFYSRQNVWPNQRRHPRRSLGTRPQRQSSLWWVLQFFEKFTKIQSWTVNNKQIYSKQQKYQATVNPLYFLHSFLQFVQLQYFYRNCHKDRHDPAMRRNHFKGSRGLSESCQRDR